MRPEKITIGTRGSKLALAQVQLVSDALKKFNPDLIIATKIITTKGDVDQSPIPLDTVGKAWFTSEIEEALLAGEIDLAVHSLKDLPPETEGNAATAKLITTTVLERADPRDVLISKSGARLDDLPSGAIIGTDSIRRKVLLLDQRPDLMVKSIRGNVDTRIKKLHAENASEGSNGAAEKYDAIVLAAAGLERLGMLHAATEFFEPAVFSIAPGQGILAAQTRSDETEILALLHGIEHAPTRIAAEAEQAFSRAIGGGCKLPVGCYAKIDGDATDADAPGTIEIFAMMGEEYESSGSVKVMRKSIKGPASDAVALAEKLAREFA